MTELTPIFTLSDRFVSESAALDPYSATGRGIPGYDDLVTDFSPDGTAARADHVRAALHELGGMSPLNDDDRLAKDYLTERLQVMVDAFEAGEWMRPLRAIAAPASTIRSVFDLMPRDGDEAWGHIASRLESVPDALAGVRASLEAGRASDVVSSQR
ncbi:MAG: DUF885 family protein, partial [Actinobacteria bacterium]|nr:DUF885 family protein [Actinomycetota bacterium]